MNTMQKSKVAAWLAAFFLTSFAYANDVACRVVGVADGDTLTCLTSDRALA